MARYQGPNRTDDCGIKPSTLTSCVRTACFTATMCCLFVFAAIFLTVSAHAQSAEDGFNPNANWQIHSFAVQPDGKILVGGNFSEIAGHSRNKIARLNPDGSLDTTFAPPAEPMAWSGP
ncbi:delta-60 repeat domain-containing protein [Desulfonatronum sp. SC1]|uniref:delta-60 repeat domain-containing protein n=1 Tax=Desulfonatronum sp. SC1 TaxID=2109626 RepID=UPI0013049A72|nr:delta-60 repeat domain-containing protein [Desulfonatronum sp. SC1]